MVANVNHLKFYKLLYLILQSGAEMYTDTQLENQLEKLIIYVCLLFSVVVCKAVV